MWLIHELMETKNNSLPSQLTLPFGAIQQLIIDCPLNCEVYTFASLTFSPKVANTPIQPFTQSRRRYKWFTLLLIIYYNLLSLRNLFTVFQGGKWCLANGDFSPDQVWQELVLLFIGGAALDELSSHINGIYFARKKNYTTQITVWLDTTELHIINRIGDIIRTTLQTYLKVDIPMEFCKHSTSSLGLKKKPYRQSGHLHSSRIPP